LNACTDNLSLRRVTFIHLALAIQAGHGIKNLMLNNVDQKYFLLLLLTNLLEKGEVPYEICRKASHLWGFTFAMNFLSPFSLRLLCPCIDF